MLHLDRIDKSFGALRAVAGVSFDITAGEVVAIAGENGAGKTTLMRIAAGELRPDRGSIVFGGVPVEFHSSRDASARGIEIVHQHFVLVGDFTVAENLALGMRSRFGLLSRSAIERIARDAVRASGIDLEDVSRRAADLSVGERSKLELIKAVSKNPRLLILDEPTAALTPIESAQLFETIRRLAASGTAVLFISHKLPEVMEIAQRIVVMRGGSVILETRPEESDAGSLALAMVGKREGARSAAASPPDQRERARPRLREEAGVRRLHCDRLRGERLQDLTLEVFEGEIVAIAGVAGNGQEELAAILRGTARPRSGTMAIDGVAAHIPEDRTRNGIVGEMTLAENIGLAQPRWQKETAAAFARALIDRFAIRATGPAQKAGTLSGGNQQKLLLARELSREPAVIIAAEPSRGLDIDGTRFVHERLLNSRSAGAAILLITSDLDEACALADRIHVIYRGTLSDAIAPNEASAMVPRLMAGLA